jgi:8-oxo-dGTP diphosphatase
MIRGKHKMKLLYGTTNPAKLAIMRSKVEGLGIEIIGLKDIDIKVDPVDESGDNPMENARVKALAYYDAVRMPVFSCDSGLYIEGVESKNQPGAYVRRVDGKEMNDEEMIAYYAKVAASMGGFAKARYKNAICLVLDEESIYEYDGLDISSECFLLTSEPHSKRVTGFPLDSISVEIESGEYYMDLEAAEGYKSKYDIGQGFRDFFIRVLENREAAAAIDGKEA